jgi:hypothetical protein
LRSWEDGEYDGLRELLTDTKREYSLAQHCAKEMAYHRRCITQILWVIFQADTFALKDALNLIMNDGTVDMSCPMFADLVLDAINAYYDMDQEGANTRLTLEQWSRRAL